MFLIQAGEGFDLDFAEGAFESIRDNYLRHDKTCTASEKKIKGVFMNVPRDVHRFPN